MSFDALTVVLSFVGPRSMLALSMTFKTLRNAITTELVVTSAMLHGGHAKKTVEEIFLLMSKQCIYAPSPLRLLRLVNGKLCERCERHQVNHVRPGYGLFVCWDCLTMSLTQAWDRSWVRFRENPRYEKALDHPRVGGPDYGRKKYLLKKRFRDKTGEISGPFVVADDIDRMVVQQSVELDEYLAGNLQAPDQSLYRDFIKAYQDSETRAQEQERERYIKKAKASKLAKDRKFEKAIQIVDQLKKLLDERWRDAAVLNYRVETSKTQGPIAFESR